MYSRMSGNKGGIRKDGSTSRPRAQAPGSQPSAPAQWRNPVPSPTSCSSHQPHVDICRGSDGNDSSVKTLFQSINYSDMLVMLLILLLLKDGSDEAPDLLLTLALYFIQD